MDKKIICIICPLGCHITIKAGKGENNFVVTGNKCERGQAYAIKECTKPERVVTTTMIGENDEIIPVKTNQAIPKGLIFDAIKIMKGTPVCLPLDVGSIIIKNILGTGADVVSTKKIYQRRR